MLLPQNIDISWQEFLTPEILNRLDKIENQIGDNFNPEREFVLRFLNNDINSIKVVILGQDPYPSPIATGRAFEVKKLNSWTQPFKQVSLKNIVRLLYKTYCNIENYSDIPSFDLIKEKIRRNEFLILPPNKLFESWDKQGVLLLNTYLTCEKGVPNSHRDIWGDFAVSIIRYIARKKPQSEWFLWGKEANQYSYLLPQNKIHSSRHPMMCNETYINDFLKSNCFKNTSQRINWLGV